MSKLATGKLVKYSEGSVFKMTAASTSCPPVPKLKDYIFNEKLGSGTYGDVYKVIFNQLIDIYH